MVVTIVLSMKVPEIPFFAKNSYKAIASKLKTLIDILFHGIVDNHIH